MEQCCPSPDHPIVQPDSKGLRMRKILRYLYFGQMFVCMNKLMLYGGLAAIFQMINLWVIYTAFATLHFCSILVYFIMCCFDLLFACMDWQRYEAVMKGKESSVLVQILFATQIIYFLVAIFYSY
jgi:hypothetical protein